MEIKFNQYEHEYLLKAVEKMQQDKKDDKEVTIPEMSHETKVALKLVGF
ncbi:hypothetical protein GJV85_03515 [Sulfurimonas aquatica]|uniref:Uncharacterized protein n=1 Tax=Sulfurimonas aquatica TaxID=2672570 RepID=A0A975AZ64_9BACT|nr:hypothetical protein [Sulfurimonas aquatica]QSZ41218.1 hypothetical protein GJV85_03515 [Sulfurimonas aquatica]